MVAGCVRRNGRAGRWGGSRVDAGAEVAAVSVYVGNSRGSMDQVWLDEWYGCVLTLFVVGK